ncbi:MAG TPA: nucleotidyltransferase domain-containing protein [Micromonosporaceae bacterium]|nr:nucleotidyltransferase domain-containing protein [Micromonosporaceae bacterium]
MHAAEHSAATFYTANRDHLAWPAIEILARMRHTLLERLQEEIGSWQPKPVHASVFGSTARGDGDARSDIDILLIRPGGIEEDESPWAEQVDDLRRRVPAWTGNRCQAFQVSLDRLAEHSAAGDPLVDSWVRDSITLVGANLRTLLRRLPAAGDEQ